MVINGREGDGLQNGRIMGEGGKHKKFLGIVSTWELEVLAILEGGGTQKVSTL